MIGRRVPDSESTAPFQPGEYGKRIVQTTDAVIWYACTPNGLLANLGQHQITEHEDGTITVSPSILVRGGHGDQQWHGWLERGVWREA